MSGATLVRTTMVGVRPLGVRGEPLHQAQAQIRGVIRRRLGDRHYHLLAEPQPHDLGGRIDWYSELEGQVRPLSTLPEAEQQAARADIDLLLADIDRIGQSLEAGRSEDGRLAGKSLRLAAKRPSDDYLFLVGDQPVTVCWGYDIEAAGAVLPTAFLPTASAPVVEPALAPVAPQMPAAMPAMAPAAAAVLTREQFPWLFWLLAGLMAILILLSASWVLRQIMPVPPDLRVTELPPEPPPPAPPAPPDPTIDLQGDIDRARDDEGKLRITLAALRDELNKRYLLCRPPEPPPQPPAPKPEPKVVERKPDPPPVPKPKPEPKVAERKPEPPPVKPPDLPEDRWRKGDLGMLKGCWRLGRDANTNLRMPNGRIVSGYDRAGRICFGDNGQGTREKSSEFPGVPPIRCRAPIIAVFRGDGTLSTTQPQVDCEPRGYFWTDRPNYLTCRRVSDSVALCRDNLGGEHEFRREG